MAATIKLTGNAVVFKSGVKLEDYKFVQKYAPEKLVLKGGEDGKEPIYKVGLTEGEGSIGKIGAYFSNKTLDAEGYATITVIVDPDGDVKEYIADEYGSALVNLAALEATIPAVVEKLKAQRGEIIDSIIVA